MSLRRWQHQGSGVHFPTLLPYTEFMKQTAELLPVEGGFCTPSEAYAVLSFLHAKGRKPQVKMDLDTKCFYFVAVNPHLSKGDGPTVYDHVVPIGTSCSDFDHRRMEKLFRLGGQVLDSLVLALADSDGTVTISRLTRGIFPPSERPPLHEDESDEDDD